MDPDAVVLDISSDEEVGWGETRGNCGSDDYDWISKLLDEVDRETDDSDDVVLVGEVVVNPKPRLKSLTAVAKSSTKDVDDDCVVLDGDPDKPIEIQSDTAVESDDLLVVGEKGQVACRDYPHPRHLCAKFPFTSTPHASLCDQCHCYVCDSLAPCVHWGTGISSIDHCHATDKEEFWKVQRKSSKKSYKAPQPVPDTSLSMGLPQINQVPPLTLLEPNSVPQNQVSRSASIRACSTSTNFGIPNIINQGRSQRSGCVVARNKFEPYLVSQQLLSPCNNIVQRDRRHNVGSLVPQFVSPHAVFKRTGSVGAAFTTNRSGYSSSNKNYGSQYSRNLPPVATPTDENPIIRWQEFHGGMIPESNTHPCSSQPSIGSIAVNSVPSQPKLSSQPNGGSIFANSVSSQPQLSSQPNGGSVFVNSGPSQPQVSSCPYVGSIFPPQVSSQTNVGSTFANSVPSPPQVSSPTNVGNTISNLLPSQPQVSSHTNVGRTFANSVPSQIPVYSPPILVSNDSQNVFQQANQSAMDPGFTDFDLSWLTPTAQNNQQPPAANSQNQSVEQTDESLLVTEFDPQFSGSTNPGSLDVRFDSWILDSQHVSAALEVSLPSGLNVLSPEPAPIDAGGDSMYIQQNDLGRV